MIEKTPFIDDVSPGSPTLADWANAVRDAAIAHYPGGNYIGTSRGGYHRTPMMEQPKKALGAGNPVVAFCTGAFAEGTTEITGTVYASDTPGVYRGDKITIAIPPGDKYNDSGSAFGYAVRIDKTWYLIDITCPNVDAGDLCAES